LTVTHEQQIEAAARAVREANALLIGAGAGMGIDSGLPDFRGTAGFWRAYPPYERLGLNLLDMANPRRFAADPGLAWGFYGHRFQLYRATQPHAGFGILRKWAERVCHGAFVFTSNVDDHFQRAGFPEDRVVECHGSIGWLQCLEQCGEGVWPVDPAVSTLIDLHEETMRAREPFPSCPTCGRLTRPNVLVFGDSHWDETRTASQAARLNAWIWNLDALCPVILECGAGRAIPTVRRFCERFAAVTNAPLVRINLREPQVQQGHISFAMGAQEALQAIDNCL
jgi:NAD-dependent SIR2 family protein deacetylase